MSIEDKALNSTTIRNASWDEAAKRGYLSYKEGEPLHPFFENFYNEHKAELGHDVLDIGCGMGAFLIPMAQRGFNITGVEPSDGMRKGAEEKLREVGLQAQIIKGESTKLDFPDENFDFVMSIGAIHHNTWLDIKRSITEAVRVLKKGKFFIFQCRSINDTKKARQQVPDTEGYTAVDLDGRKKDVIQHYFTKEELDKLAVENGLEVVGEPHETLNADKVDSKKIGARWWVVYRKI